MNFWDIVRGANSNLLRNKGRSFLTILAIFIGSFTIIMTTGVNNGVNTYIDKQMASAGGEGYLEIMRESSVTSGLGGLSNDVQEYSTEDNSTASMIITSKDIEKIRAVDGIKTAKPWVMLQPEYITSASTDKKFTIDLSALPTDTIRIDMAAGRIVSIDSDTPEIAIADKYVKPLGFSSNQDAVGKTVKVAMANQITGDITEIELTISGVMNPSVIGMGRSWVNDRAANKLSDQVMYFFITLYNNLEDHSGIVLCATKHLAKRIQRGRKLNKKGYNEIFSRIGRRFIELQGISTADVTAICMANGLTEAGKIREVMEECENDLRRVKRKVHALKNA